MGAPMPTDNSFSTRKAETAIGTSAATATQLLRIPWADPYNMKARLKKLQITNTVSGNCSVYFWDADLSNTTPVTRGTGTITNALLHIGIAASPIASGGGTTVTYSEDQLPALEFEAGIAFAATNINTQVSGEFEIL